ncbi:MAG TPA: hypothetical protein VIM79_16980, partial [Niastella sp.]
MKSFFIGLCLLIMMGAFQKCSKKDVITNYLPDDSIGIINKWILDTMRRYSYWTNDIPATPNFSVTPEAFFNSIKSPHDRFSWISNGASITPPSNSWFTYGFHYAFAQAPGYDGYLGVVTFVNKNGGADKAGLKRGSYFIKVNGIAVNQYNLNTVN